MKLRTILSAGIVALVFALMVLTVPGYTQGNTPSYLANGTSVVTRAPVTETYSPVMTPEYTPPPATFSPVSTPCPPEKKKHTSFK